MSKGILAFGICFLMICSVFIPVSIGFNVKVSKIDQPFTLNNGNTLYVGGSGPENYSTIQVAINDAVDKDTVYVYDDSSPYYEQILIDKSINLVGENKFTTIIDADKEGSPVTITNDFCLVSGFTLINCKKPDENFKYVVVKIDSCNNVTIENNILSIGEMQYIRHVAAIYLDNSSDNKILDNILFEDDMKYYCPGIYLDNNCNNNLVSGNNISVYTIGIGIRWNGNCKNNIISENIIHKNKIGIEIGIDCSYNEILNNTIENNYVQGIVFRNAHHNTISGNHILENGDGKAFKCGIEIFGEKSTNNYILDNTISENSPIGIFIQDAYDNTIMRNNLIDNDGEGTPREKWWGNAYFLCGFKLGKLFNLNSWDNNYWSDYRGLGFFPKIIHGEISILFLSHFNWFNIDWRPAREPYDI